MFLNYFNNFKYININIIFIYFQIKHTLKKKTLWSSWNHRHLTCEHSYNRIVMRMIQNRNVLILKFYAECHHLEVNFMPISSYSFRTREALDTLIHHAAHMRSSCNAFASVLWVNAFHVIFCFSCHPRFVQYETMAMDCKPHYPRWHQENSD